MRIAKYESTIPLFLNDFCINICTCQKKVVILQAKLRGGYYEERSDADD